MEFEFDEDQRLLQQSVRETLAKTRSLPEDQQWSTYLDLGCLQAPLVELAIVCEELGYIADPAPFLATATWFAPLAGRLPEGGAGTGVFDLALTGLAITIVGACRKILDMTVASVKQRHQFGVPIDSFQVVKHKAADMYAAIERARVLAYFAALMAKAAAGDLLLGMASVHRQALINEEVAA